MPRAGTKDTDGSVNPLYPTLPAQLSWDCDLSLITLGTEEAPRGLTRVKVPTFSKDRALSQGPVLQKCAWTQLEPAFLARVPEHSLAWSLLGGGMGCGVTEDLSPFFSFPANIWKARLLPGSYRLEN